MSVSVGAGVTGQTASRGMTGSRLVYDRLAWGLLLAHVVALVFGLAGMLIALPNPHLWAGSPLGRETFRFGMEYAGGLHILFGAGAMLAYGLGYLGARRTWIFFGVSVSVSLASELIGTTTGWPFGNYAYQEGLGWKVLGHVPFTIPLSWFYMGLASMVLAGRLAASRGVRSSRLSVLMVLGGAWLLMGWDLVLDPAMAHESMPLKFWVWFETGWYFGMPLKNLAAWFMTGLVYMAIGAWLWQRAADPRDAVPSETGLASLPTGLPMWVYLTNLAFASVLSWSVGLWEPIVLSLVWAAPLLLPLLLRPDRPGRPGHPEGPVSPRAVA